MHLKEAIWPIASTPALKGYSMQSHFPSFCPLPYVAISCARSNMLGASTCSVLLNSAFQSTSKLQVKKFLKAILPAFQFLPST